jgi:hypothetical protein
MSKHLAFIVSAVAATHFAWLVTGSDAFAMRTVRTEGLDTVSQGTTPPAPAAGQTMEPTLVALRAAAQERMRQDRVTFGSEQFREIEQLYQSVNRDLHGPAAKDTLRQLVQRYPKSNRAGCAVLYLAQLSNGNEREEYLKTAIRDHADARYGDGAQVGALARAQLASYLASVGRVDDAQRMAEEMAKLFPGAVDHSGNRLVDGLRRMSLLR